MIKIQKRETPEQRLLKAIFGPNPKKLYRCYKCRKRIHSPGPIWVNGHYYHSKCLSASTIELQDVPKLSEIVHARDIGRKGNGRYIWTACPRCHKERWLLMYNLKYSKYNGLCINCWNQRNRLTDGSYIRRSHGYIKLKLQPDDFFYPMADKEGYVLEHRLVMAKHLGRCLHSWEVVRHQNDVRKDDNRIEVLELMTDETNIQIMTLESKIKRLEERNTPLVAEAI